MVPRNSSSGNVATSPILVPHRLFRASEQSSSFRLTLACWRYHTYCLLVSQGRLQHSAFLDGVERRSTVDRNVRRLKASHTKSSRQAASFGGPHYRDTLEIIYREKPNTDRRYHMLDIHHLSKLRIAQPFGHKNISYTKAPGTRYQLLLYQVPRIARATHGIDPRSRAQSKPMNMSC